MPSKSSKQEKLMAAVAHNPEFARKVGVPQSVGEDFNNADQARKNEDVHKSDYGPKGTAAGAQYQSHANLERKASNTGDVAGEGPNKNVKSYSTKPGQLSAKQQAAKENSPARVKALSGPVTKPQLTEEEIAQYKANLTKDEQNIKCTTCGFAQAPEDRAKDSAGCKGSKPHTWPVAKYDMLEVSPDGKQELVEGKEPLKKDPKKRWKELKKALDHKKAFIDLEEELSDDEEQQPQQDDAAALQQEIGSDDMQQEQPADAGADSEAVSAGPEEEGQEQPQEQEEMPEEGNGEDQPDPQELIDALKEEGHSDQEISYIMHGQHAAEVDETKAAKADATRAMSDIDIENAKSQAELERSHQEQLMAHEREHKKRMSDLEFEHAQKKHVLVDQDAAHKQRMSDVEYQQSQQANPQALEQEHKKRMLDLEYEKAKKESSQTDGSEGDAEANKQMKMLEVEKKKLELQLRKEEIKMELEFKKREHELKLKMMEVQLKEQAKQKQEIGGIKHEHKLKEAKNPPKKPLKKSEEENDEDRDQ